MSCLLNPRRPAPNYPPLPAIEVILFHRTDRTGPGATKLDDADKSSHQCYGKLLRRGNLTVPNQAHWHVAGKTLMAIGKSRKQTQRYSSELPDGG